MKIIFTTFVYIVSLLVSYTTFCQTTAADISKHGFQYIDWQFEQNDIIFVSRTAYDDTADGANNFHDANFLTFHRIENFRKQHDKSKE